MVVRSYGLMIGDGMGNDGIDCKGFGRMLGMCVTVINSRSGNEEMYQVERGG